MVKTTPKIVKEIMPAFPLDGRVVKAPIVPFARLSLTSFLVIPFFL